MITSISNAMTSMAEINAVSKLYCDSSYKDQRFLNQGERIKRRYELIKVAEQAKPYFSERFKILLDDFLNWEQALPDYCEKDLPSKLVWNAKQDEIEKEMFSAPVSNFLK